MLACFLFVKNVHFLLDRAQATSILGNLACLLVCQKKKGGYSPRGGGTVIYGPYRYVPL